MTNFFNVCELFVLLFPFTFFPLCLYKWLALGAVINYVINSPSFVWTPVIFVCFFTWWCGRTPQRFAPSCTTLQETCDHIFPRSLPAVAWSKHSGDQSYPARRPKKQKTITKLFIQAPIVYSKIKQIFILVLHLDFPGREPDTPRGAAW